MKKKLLASCLFFLVPFLTYASSTNYNLSEFTKFYGASSFDSAGISVSTAGDVNNDGYDDFLVGAIGCDEGGSGSGCVYLIYGSASSSTAKNLGSSSSMIQFTGESASDWAGFSVSSAGDVNNDGYDDILIGAPFNDDQPGVSTGAVYLIFGSSSLSSMSLSNDSIVKFVGETNEDQAGYSTSSAGDVNNDGYSDILIGAIANDAGGDNAGRAYLIYGSASLSSKSLSDSSVVKMAGEENYNSAGTSVSSAGDVNNDGYSDILIGAPNNSSNGAAYLFYGGTNGTTYEQLSGTFSLSSADTKFNGENADDNSGIAVSSAGDVNNDGYDDILIGANTNDAGGINAGKIYFYYGGTNGSTFGLLSGSNSLSTSDINYVGESAEDRAGFSVASAGDVNKDGFDDILIGAHQNDASGINAGSTYLIYGATSLTSGNLSVYATLKFTGEQTGDNSGRAVSSAGDVNNDGYSDIIIGAYLNDFRSDAGTAYLGYIYVDEDRDGILGTNGLFDGTDCNDNDSTVSANQSYYEDLDNDTYGSSVTTSVCSSTPPTGFVRNNTDCNDSDAAVNTNQTYYQDADSDTLGNLNQTLSVCQNTSPTGYVINTLDPDDGNFHKVASYDSQYVLALNNSGTTIYLLDLINNQTLKTVTLSKTRTYATNSIKIKTIRNKKFAVVTSKKGKQILLSLVRINIAKANLSKKDQLKVKNKNIKPAKTNTADEIYINLKNKSSKIIVRYLVNKKYQLIKNN